MEPLLGVSTRRPDELKPEDAGRLVPERGLVQLQRLLKELRKML
jgi:hypothetical protein